MEKEKIIDLEITKDFGEDIKLDIVKETTPKTAQGIDVKDVAGFPTRPPIDAKVRNEKP